MPILEYTFEELCDLEEMLSKTEDRESDNVYRGDDYDTETHFSEAFIKRTVMDCVEGCHKGFHKVRYVRRTSQEVYGYLLSIEFMPLRVGRHQLNARVFREAIFEAPLESLPLMLEDAVLGTIARWRFRLGR